MSGHGRRACLRTIAGAIAVISTAGANSATSELQGDIDRVLTSGGTGPVCMVRLTEWPADAGVQCPGRWLAFRCTAETPGGEHARRMFDSVRDALADGQRVALRVTDDERVGQFCLVTRITVPDSSDQEEDSDRDGVADLDDDVPLDASETVDSDDDGLGNYADPDDDNDGADDSVDAFPLDPSETTDTDGGGLGDNADADDDNDGVPDLEDAFPLDPKEWSDADGDGVGDNADPPSSSFPLSVGIPTGISYFDGHLYVVDSSGTYRYSREAPEARVIGYTLDGASDASRSFDIEVVDNAPSRCRTGSALCSSRTYRLGDMTRSADRFYVAEVVQHYRDRGTGGSASYTNHVRAYTFRGERDAAADWDPYSHLWTGGLAFANGYLYVAYASFGSRRVTGYATSGARRSDLDFRLDESSSRGSGQPRVAFGNETFYDAGFEFDEIRAYTVEGERTPSRDIRLDACNRNPAGITVGPEAVYVVDVPNWGTYPDGCEERSKVFAYSTKTEVRTCPSTRGSSLLEGAVVEMYQGPLASVWRAADCSSTDYGPLVSGREAAIVLRFDHLDRTAPDVGLSVDGQRVVAETSDTRVSGGGRWTTSTTYVVAGAHFRSGGTMTFSTGSRITHDSDYADGFQVPIRARAVVPLRVTFVPIRTPDDLAPLVEPDSYMEAIRDFFPVGDYRTTVGPVLNMKYSGTFTPRAAAQDLSRRWYREADADEFYHGVFPFRSGRCGYALRSAPVAVSAAIDSFPSRYANPCPNVHAHEIGHNFGLDHADCGSPGDLDPLYPYPNADIGPRRGWLLSGRRFIEPDSGYYDIMSYCQPNFVSDYHYDKALVHLQRLDTPAPSYAESNGSANEELAADHGVNAPPLDGVAAAPGDTMDSEAGRTVVVTGVVGADGEFSALQVDASDRPALAPPADSTFTLSVLDADGIEIHTQGLAVHADAYGHLSVWGARFAQTDGTPRSVIVRNADGAVVFQDEVPPERAPAANR